MKLSMSKYYSKFPESLFVPVNPAEYRDVCIKGYEKAEKSSVCICGLVRNIERPDYLFSCLEKISQLFRSSYIYLYENDSENDTVKYLEEWSKQKYRRNFLSEKLDREQNAQDMSLRRRKDMAFYRNKYLVEAQRLQYDYTIVLDTDLFGYSYEGIIHSLGLDLDAVGSNGLLYRQVDNHIEKLYYDSWAYRGIGKDNDLNNNLINKKRGEDPIEVDSCFGGLALYKAPVLDGCEYQDWDCDHVTLHKQVRNNGYRVWMNPSQITLYNSHYYQM